MHGLLLSDEPFMDQMGAFESSLDGRTAQCLLGVQICPRPRLPSTQCVAPTLSTISYACRKIHHIVMLSTWLGTFEVQRSSEMPAQLKVVAGVSFA
jgi:hypothetical protein